MHSAPSGISTWASPCPSAPAMWAVVLSMVDDPIHRRDLRSETGQIGHLVHLRIVVKVRSGRSGLRRRDLLGHVAILQADHQRALGEGGQQLRQRDRAQVPDQRPAAPCHPDDRRAPGLRRVACRAARRPAPHRATDSRQGCAAGQSLQVARQVAEVDQFLRRHRCGLPTGSSSGRECATPSRLPLQRGAQPPVRDQRDPHAGRRSGARRSSGSSASWSPIPCSPISNTRSSAASGSGAAFPRDPRAVRLGEPPREPGGCPPAKSPSRKRKAP